MELLAPHLHSAVPRLSVAGHEILALLAGSGGCIVSADSFAADLGLRSRHQLTRALRREGLPQIEELCAWIKVLQWLLGWEHTHQSLFTLGLDAELHPPTCYRLVKRVSGKTWRQACADGYAIMLLSFVNRCLGLRHGREAAVRSAVGRIA
jgi:hypothetical protein